MLLILEKCDVIIFVYQLLVFDEGENDNYQSYMYLSAWSSMQATLYTFARNVLSD